MTIIENPPRLIAEHLFRAVQRPSVKDFMRLAGSAEVLGVTVTGDAPIASSILVAADEGLLDEDVLVVAIERNGEVITPRGHSGVKPGDLVTAFSRRGFAPDVMQVFTTEE